MGETFLSKMYVSLIFSRVPGVNPTPASAILDGPASFVKNVFAILGEIYLSLVYGENKLE